jgi:hypothetical protein
MTTSRPGQPVTVGIIGAGRMGSLHAESWPAACPAPGSPPSPTRPPAPRTS